ncbi:SiaB family protein kinase [Cohnella caldifontis]|uniref:SiaB family protein kinase n=1 Tax=Cohnella caldifontis TaxID=3027471 RepID=UPI0023ED371B|nr:SiaB family protein kinase [Cohnella sp. YIM B05605]
MIDKQLLNVQKLLQDHGILICFSGRLSQQLIEEYGEAVKSYLESENRPKNEIFHIFSIFIEMTQNIKNYCTRISGSALGDQIAQSSIVTIGKDGQGSYICAGNLIEEEDLRELTGRIDALVRLNKDELKAFYKDQLKKNDPQNGAGVGLIDMARKATSPLAYSVTKLGNNLSFFTLKAVV